MTTAKTFSSLKVLLCAWDKKMQPFGEAMKNGKANMPPMLQALEWDIVTIQQVSHLS